MKERNYNRLNYAAAVIGIIVLIWAFSQTYCSGVM